MVDTLGTTAQPSMMSFEANYTISTQLASDATAMPEEMKWCLAATYGLPCTTIHWSPLKMDSRVIA